MCEEQQKNTKPNRPAGGRYCWHNILFHYCLFMCLGRSHIVRPGAELPVDAVFPGHPAPVHMPAQPVDEAGNAGRHKNVAAFPGAAAADRFGQGAQRGVEIRRGSLGHVFAHRGQKTAADADAVSPAKPGAVRKMAQHLQRKPGVLRS